MYTDCVPMNLKIFNAEVAKFGNFVQIFTDGSKTFSGTGCACLVKQYDVSIKLKLPDCASIYTAELTAISKAVEWVVTNEIPRAIIVSDSKSALLSLGTPPYVKSQNVLLSDIFQKCNEGTSQIVFLWAKAHSGIHGNETADLLAKEATVCGDDVIQDTVFTDLVSKLRIGQQRKWEHEWRKYTSTSRNPYTLLHPNLPTKTELLAKHLPRPIISTFYRLKTGHARYPGHLHRIGVAESSICDCDQSSTCDLNHILFYCYKYAPQRQQLLQNLNTLNVEHPLNITYLLSTQNEQIYKNVYKFFQDSQIQL